MVGNIALKLRDKLKSEVTIVNGGDTFNTRGVIRTNCFDILCSHYRGWANRGLRQIILVGNHDQEDKGGEIHPMRAFASFSKDWVVVDKPTIVDRFVCFPYMNMDAAKEYIFANSSKFKGLDGIVHWGISGAHRNDRNIDTDGVSVSILRHFRTVFSGHYHFRHRFENVQYIGSPMQQSLAEKDQEKGVLLFDAVKNVTQFIEIKGTAKYRDVEITWSEDGKMVLPDISSKPGDYCRVNITGDSDKVAGVTRDFLKEKFPDLNINIERNIKERHFSRLSLKGDDVIDVGNLIQKYTEFVDTELDRERLINIGRELAGVV